MNETPSHDVIFAMLKDALIHIKQLNNRIDALSAQIETKRAGEIRVDANKKYIYMETRAIWKDKKLDIETTKALRAKVLELLNVSGQQVIIERTNDNGKSYKVYLMKYAFNVETLNAFQERVSMFDFNGKSYGIHGIAAAQGELIDE